MRIPEEVINQIRTSVNIVDVISQYVSLSKKGRNYTGLCPFHQEKTPSFTVSSDKQIYNCFGCGAGGNVITFVMEMESCSFQEAIVKLANEASIDLKVDGIIPQHKHVDEASHQMLEMHSRLSKLYHHHLLNSEEGKAAREYLESRGISKESIEEFQIGYAPSSDLALQYLKSCGYALELMEDASLVHKTEQGTFIDLFRNRVMFPLWDESGQVIAFSGRAIGDSNPKYLNSKETKIFQKSRVLYNFHKARQEMKKTNKIVLFEGHLDVVSAFQAGVRNGVATMGTAFTEEHAKVLGKVSKQFVLCYDSDNAGLKAASAVGRLLLEKRYDVSVCVLPDGLDPDDYIQKFGASQFEKEIINGSIAYISFQMEYLKKGKNLSNEADLISYVKSVLKEFSFAKDKIEEGIYLNKLSKITGLSNEELLQMRGVVETRPQQKQPSRPVMQPLQSKKGITAYNKIQNAERALIAYMLRDAELSTRIQGIVFDQFAYDVHRAIVTYLYAYYEQGNDPDLSHFLDFVQDANLRKLIIEIDSKTLQESISELELEDYLHQILKEYPRLLRLENIKKEIEEAERIGDYIRAAKLAQEHFTHSLH